MRVEPIHNEVALRLMVQVSDLEAMNMKGKVTSRALNADKSRSKPAAYSRYNHSIKGLDLHAIANDLQIDQNKTAILRLFRRQELLKILKLLDRRKLLNGMRFFTKSQLLRLLKTLPKRTLIKMLLKLFTLEELIRRMPTRELMRFVASSRMDSNMLLKAFYKMDPKFIHYMLGKILGRDTSHLKHSELMGVMKQLNKRHIMQAMQNLPFKALQPFIFLAIKNDPELLMAMGGGFMMKMFATMPKNHLLKAFEVLDNAKLTEMLGNLQDQFLVMTAAQVDTSMLQQFLVGEKGDLLALLAGADLSSAA